MIVASTGAQAHPSCWTHEYLLRHCEGYRVDTAEGHLGFVEEIVLLPGESEPIGYLVHGARGLTFVSLHQIRDFAPEAQRIVAEPLHRGRPRGQPPRAAGDQ